MTFRDFLCLVLMLPVLVVPHTVFAAMSDGAKNKLDLRQAERLATLPMGCIQSPFPYKSGVVIAKEADLALPQKHHPAFYGCFDWHSAVHGHWSLIYLLKRFPELSGGQEIRHKISENLTASNIAAEIDYFSMNKSSATFERTYGWAWLLKLAEELYTWDGAYARKLFDNLRPLADLICEKYIEYLPKLVYPIRVGEHTNTAFGLSFAYDYAVTVGHDELREVIAQRSRDFYGSDASCPVDWEPSGHDFLSPCLEELALMRRVLDASEFEVWAARFIPSLGSEVLSLAPGEIIDRSDGKLVHLDGLNFSRAWCLYPLIELYPFLWAVAEQHLDHSLSKITDGDYAGQHWLASFALYALKTRDEIGRAD